MQGMCAAYGNDLLWLPPAVLQQAHLVQGHGRDVLLGVLEDYSPHPLAKGETTMVGLFLQHMTRSHRKGCMPEHKRVGQEIWICAPSLCMDIPSIHMILQGNDTRFYPGRLVSNNENSCIELVYVDGSLMNFERYEDAYIVVRLSHS
jgi:hypothetical protein